jgi:hypothetical protein
MAAFFWWSNRLPRVISRKSEIFLIVVGGKWNFLVTNGDLIFC